MHNILRLMIPETCKRQLHRAADTNKKTTDKVLCTLEECSPALVGQMKTDRREIKRVIGQ